MELEITFEYEAETGRWLADIEAIPGVTLYGNTKEEAIKNVKILALQVIADFIQHGEMQDPDYIRFISPKEPIAA